MLKATERFSDTMPMAFFELAKDGTVIFANRKAGELFNSPINKLAGQKIVSIFPQDSQQEVTTFISATIGRHAEIKSTVAFGKNRFVELRGINNDSISFFLFIEDVTEKISSQRECRLAINEAISVKVEEEKKREFLLSVASHELRTPLAVIKAYAEMMMKKPDRRGGGKYIQYLTTIDEKVDILTKLINDLLDMTKARVGKLEFFDEVFDFDELAEKTIAEIQSTSVTRRIIKKGRAEKFIFADKERIGQLFGNIINNALKFSPNGKPVMVRLGSAKGEIDVSITDYGMGIPADKSKKIFEPFYKIVDPKIKKHDGLGLGLALSLEIVKHYGGKLWVETRTGEGSTFHFSLPYKKK